MVHDSYAFRGQLSAVVPLKKLPVLSWQPGIGYEHWWSDRTVDVYGSPNSLRFESPIAPEVANAFLVGAGLRYAKRTFVASVDAMMGLGWMIDGDDETVLAFPEAAAAILWCVPLDLLAICPTAMGTYSYQLESVDVDDKDFDYAGAMVNVPGSLDPSRAMFALGVTLTLGRP